MRCGCLNLAKRTVTPDLDATYAQRTHEKLLALGMPTEALDRDQLGARYPDLDADLGRLDPEAGVVDVRRRHRGADARAARVPGSDVYEGVVAPPAAGDFAARALVVTAGHGTNDVLARLAGCDLAGPDQPRPAERGQVLSRPRARASASPPSGCRCSPTSTPASTATRSSTGSSTR